MAMSLGATAQTTQAVTGETIKKPAAKKVETKKKVEAKKPMPKKIVASKKPPIPPKVTVYKNDPNAPILRDKDGNVIPTNPSAYDVSSAIGKKK